MPSLKMKMKSTMGCLREKNGLHVCQKSNKIFKNSLLQAKSLQQEAQIDTFISNKKDDSACSEVTVQELRCNETSCCALLEDKDSGSINKNSCEYENCNVSDFFISDMIVSSSTVEEATCLLPDHKYDESSIFLDDEYMLLTFLEDSVDCDDKTEHFSEPVMSSQESNLYMAIHQLKSNSQEPDVNNYFDWDPSECFDPQMFINNLPDLSEVVSPSERKKMVTLVLDLDETLVHSSLEHCDDADFSFQVFIDFKEHTVYVKQRPYVKEFLERVSEMFQIVVFTASLSIYANQLLDILDPHGKIISRRAYRESCVFADGIYTKDLTVLGVDLAKVAIIDNCPQVFRFQLNNGIPIKSWFDDPSDHALISLLPFLETLADAKDVRPLIAKRFGNKE